MSSVTVFIRMSPRLISSQAQWDAEIASGAMESSRYPELHHTPCEDGFAAAIPGDTNNTFRCNNVSISRGYTA